MTDATAAGGMGPGRYAIGGREILVGDDGAAWAVIGDVSGKGPAAAAIVGLARHTLRALGRRTRHPRHLLSDLHDALLREGRGEFCTVQCARIVADPGGGLTMTLAGAGHPAAVLRRADGGIARIGSGGTLIGLPVDTAFVEEVVHLVAGDAVVFTTDGVTEERNAAGEQFGEVRLGLAVRGAPPPHAPVVEKLGMHFVRVLEDNAQPGQQNQQNPMLRIVTPSGKVGFVAVDAIAPLGNDQICYGKEGAGWKIAGFIGGE